MLLSFETFLLELFFCIGSVLGLRLLLGGLFGPRLCRLLWLIVIIRALFPFAVPLPYHPFGLLTREENDWHAVETRPTRQEYRQNTGIPVLGMEDDGQSVANRLLPAESHEPAVAHPSTRRKVVKYGVAFWLAGTGILLGVTLVRNRLLIARATRQPVAVPDWVQLLFLETKEKLHLRVWPVLIVSPCVASPCLVGAIRPRILIPESLLESGGEQAPKEADREAVRYILLHELVHLKHGDIWYSWLWTLTLAVHWYNPLFWMLGRWISFDCEAACDDRVLASLSPEERRSYGGSLLEMMSMLNPPPLRTPGFSAVIETPSNLERRLSLMKRYKTQTLSQTAAGFLILALLAGFSLTSHAGQKPTISPEKARMIGYVENHFMQGYRDITMRKSLEWGEVTVDADGNNAIRYKFEALIWDKDRVIDCAVFTFDKKGGFVGSKKVEGYPQEVKPEKVDTTTLVGLQRLVEKFFRQNYMDISDRETVAWGEPVTEPNGNRSLTYQYNAEIRGKEWLAIEEQFTFAPDGTFVRVKKLSKTPMKKDETDNAAVTRPGMKAADAFLALLAAGEFDKAFGEMNAQAKSMIKAEALKFAWVQLTDELGAYKSSQVIGTHTVSEQGREYLQVLEDVLFKQGQAVLRVVLDKDLKVAGFFIVSSSGKSPAEGKKQAVKVETGKPDAKRSIERMGEGWRLFSQGNSAEAEPVFAEAVALNPKNARALQGLGWACWSQGKKEPAKEAFEKCLELDARNAAALNGLGQIALHDDDQDKAIEYWTKGIAADPRASGPAFGLGNLYADRGDYENAVKYYRIARKAEPGEPEIQRRLQNAIEMQKKK